MDTLMELTPDRSCWNYFLKYGIGATELDRLLSEVEVAVGLNMLDSKFHYDVAEYDNAGYVTATLSAIDARTGFSLRQTLEAGWIG